MTSNYYIPLHEEPARRGLHSRLLKVFCVLSAISNLALLWLLTTTTNRPGCNISRDTPHLYSPADHVVRQKIVKFTRGVEDDIPIYERRPSDAVDAAWRDLWSVAQTRIPRSEAAKMPNRTWPLQREPGQYMFALDVFHQIHCLDVLRQQVHRGRGFNYTHVPISHVRHCIGAIRQALLCAADISPVVWQWSEERQLVEQRDDIVHVCRDFGQIWEWAAGRTFIAQDSDFRVYVEDDLDISS
ncbi:hypothetical protein MVEN_00475100 [Mycena venus]|uniref:Tat pathway signal sequence n=1 Tax=Mycena venus TaxID=2733690 RepID=A0A8H6YW32_9AGAR|nr:hypothetical protein MVEN_00475100 [Mycena venus]